MKNVIFCFSGTGNSRRAARLIAAQLGGATIVSVKEGVCSDLAEDADTVGFLCPVYEWDVPETMKRFAQRLRVNEKAYVFMVATYVAVHGRCFETMDAILREKGTRLHYGKALRCVGSQCVAYEPFPAPRVMVPYADWRAERIGREVAAKRQNRYPAASILTKKLHEKMIMPFIAVQHEYDKGFYTTDQCVGCGLCSRICPCGNISLSEGRPVWNHGCIGCNACVVYCPKKAILFQTPEAYRQLDNVITRRLGLPDRRTRYHNPHITARDLIAECEVVEH